MAENVQFLLTARDLTAGAFSSVRAGLNGIGAQVISVRGLVGTLAGAFGVSAFAAGVKGASEAADAAAKMGDRLGIATERLIGQRQAAELAGASSEALSAGYKAMTNAAIEAARGSAEYDRAFRILNVDAQQFINLPMDEQLSMVVDRLGQVENATARNYAANKLLGRGYEELMGLVAEGSAQFRKAQADAVAWGLAINRVDAAKIEMMNDAVTRGMSAMKGLFTTIAVNVAPVVKLLADRWADAAVEANGFRTDVSSAMEAVVRGVAYAINVVRGLEFAWAGLKYVIAAVVDAGVQGLKHWADATANSKIVEWAQYIPGPVGLAAKAMRAFASEGKNAIADFALSTADAVAKAKKELDDLAERGVIDPEQFVAKFKAVKSAMEREARAIAEQREKFMKGGAVELPTDFRADEQTAKQIEEGLEEERRVQSEALQWTAFYFNQKFTLLQNSLAQELQAENDAYNQRLAWLGMFSEEQLAQFGGYAAMREGLERAHQSRLQSIEAAKHQSLRQMQMQTFQLAGELLQQFAGQSKAAAIAAIAIQKGLAIASVIVNTEAAIARGYMELGPWLGGAFEAKMRTMEAVSIGLIAATGLVQAAGVGGGAAPGSPANPQSVTPVAPAVPANAAQQQVPTTIIHMPAGVDRNKMSYTGDDVFGLLKAIEEATRDGGRVVVT